MPKGIPLGPASVTPIDRPDSYRDSSVSNH